MRGEEWCCISQPWYIYVCVCILTCVNICTHIYKFAQACVEMRRNELCFIYIFVCMFIFVNMYTHKYMYICIGVRRNAGRRTV